MIGPRERPVPREPARRLRRRQPLPGQRHPGRPVRAQSGRGQVVDAAIVDGASSLMTQFVGMGHRGQFVEQRESNMLDGAAPWYTIYETSDGQHLSVGAIEPQFFAQPASASGLRRSGTRRRTIACAGRNCGRKWPRSSAGARATPAALLQDTDCCVAPVLSLGKRRAIRTTACAARSSMSRVSASRLPRRASRARPRRRGVAAQATAGAEVLARWTREPAARSGPRPRTARPTGPCTWSAGGPMPSSSPPRRPPRRERAGAS
ncbi:CoA transferase [Delftia tsuruhatensis]